VLSGNVSTDSGASHRTLIEQEENEDMHVNESVYSLSLRSQGEAYIKELNYEMTLSATGGNPDINVTKAELSSTRSGTYACSKNEMTTGENVTDKKYTITCRAVGDGYQTMVDGESTNFNINLDLSVSTILSSGQ